MSWIKYLHVIQGRIRGIPGLILKGNNAWPVRMPLRTSGISRPPLVGQKPVRKPKKKYLHVIDML